MTWTIPAVGRHTSGYGPRNTGIPGASTYHRGHDIAPPVKGQRGVPVWAVGPGRVAGREYNSARGRFVRIRHDDGSMTLCQHLDRFDVAYGQRVTTGQQIGLMGDSGVGAGVHLHFECYEAGANAYVLANAVDPVAFMRHRGVDLATGARLVDLDRPIPTVPDLPDFPDLPEPVRSWIVTATPAEITEAMRSALVAARPVDYIHFRYGGAWYEWSASEDGYRVIRDPAGTDVVTRRRQVLADSGFKVRVWADGRDVTEPRAFGRSLDGPVIVQTTP